MVKILPENIIQAVDFEHLIGFNYPAFCIGTFCRKYECAKMILDSKKTFTLAIMAYSLFLCGEITGFNERLIWLIPWTLCPLSGITCCWQLFKFQFTQGKVIKWLQFLGCHSLEIYIIHDFFVIKMPIIGETVIKLVNMGNYEAISTGLTLQLIHSIIISTVICAICIVVFKVLRYSPVLSLALFGRKN